MLPNPNPNSPVFKTGKVSCEGNSPSLMLQRVSGKATLQCAGSGKLVMKITLLMAYSRRPYSPIARNEKLSHRTFFG